MSTNDAEITVTVEGDQVTYTWRGEDAEARHERWALTSEETWDTQAPS